MVRGTPGKKRTHTISVRVDPDALAAWDAAREASGRKEMGAWVRAVVEDAIGTYAPGQRPGDVPRVPEVNAEAYAHLTAAANNLNQLTRYSHQDEALHPEVVAAIRLVVAAAWEVRGLVGRVDGPSAQPDPEVWAKAAAAPASGPRAEAALRSGSALPPDDAQQPKHHEPETTSAQPAPVSGEETTADRVRTIMEGLRGKSS